MESRGGDAMGGLIEFLKTKDGVMLTLWTKIPGAWIYNSYSKVVVTIDIVTASCTIKSDRANLPSSLDREYKSVQKNELKFICSSQQYCMSEAENQYVALVGNILYYFVCAKMLQVSSASLYVNAWTVPRNQLVDTRMKLRDRVRSYLHGRQETTALFGRFSEYTREKALSLSDLYHVHFDGLVFALANTVKELGMMMSIALRFEPWSLPISVNEFASESHFPVLRCVGRGITISEAALVREGGSSIVPTGSAVVFGVVGVRELVFWLTPGTNELRWSAVLAWSKPLSLRAVSSAANNMAQKWLFAMSCAVIIDFCLQRETKIQARGGGRSNGTRLSSFSISLHIFRQLGPKIVGSMPMCKNRVVKNLVDTVFELSKKVEERDYPEKFTIDRISRSIDCLGAVMEQWFLPLLSFRDHDPFRDHFLHVLSRRHTIIDTQADEFKDENGNALSATNGDALVRTDKIETMEDSSLFFGSKRATEVSDEFVVSLFDEFCDCAPNACATLPSVSELDIKRSNLDNLLFDIVDRNIKPFEDSSARLSFVINGLKEVFCCVNELIAEFFIAKLIYLGQFLVSPQDSLYRQMALTSFGVNTQNGYAVVRQNMLKKVIVTLSNGGSVLELLDWKVREQLTQDIIDFCIIVRFATPKQSILHYGDIGGVFAFDKTMMTALDGNVEDGEPCRMLIPPVSTQPKNATGEVQSDAVALVLAPITKAVVIPL